MEEEKESGRGIRDGRKLCARHHKVQSEKSSELCNFCIALVSMSPLVSCTKDMTDGEREIFLNLCEQLRMMYKKLVSEEVQKNDKH